MKKALFDSILLRLGEKISSIKELPGGINSRVFKIITEKHRKLIIKQSLRQKNNYQSRMTTEFNGLKFLWRNGVRMIPRPIIFDNKKQISIFSFIEGNKLEPQTIEMDDINQTVQFLNKLHSLNNIEDAVKQPRAAEACFSLSAYIRNIELRLKKIIRANSQNRELTKFLLKEFKPFFREIKVEIKDKTKKMKIDLKRELTDGEKTLSPSDLGFHNCLKNDKGQLYFIDFEHYGWDDPAKMVCDFFLQPQVPVPYKYRKIFFEKINKYYSNNTNLVKRTPLVYMLLSLKWCLIMLNIFLETHADVKKCEQQLQKAKKKLQKAKSEIRRSVFPISLTIHKLHG